MWVKEAIIRVELIGAIIPANRRTAKRFDFYL
jgi:hypothetical protein